jgi:hypothetical protein
VKRIAAGIGLAAIVFSTEALAKDLPVGRMRRATESNKEVGIGIGARWNNACKSVGIPQVQLDTAPAHGFVCLRSGLVKPSNVLFGGAKHCMPLEIEGVEVVYRSRPGFDGTDTLGYTLRFPRGTKPLIVDIRIKPAAGTARKDNDPTFTRQPPGEIPSCAALVS